MMERHSKKELTRLILTALVLAGGSFYMPVAEADEITITASTTLPSSEDEPVGGLARRSDKIYANKDKDAGATKDSVTINGVPSGYTGYDFCGALQISINANNPGCTITFNGGTVKDIYGLYNITATYDAARNTVNIHGGTVSGNVYGAMGGIGSSRFTEYNEVAINPTKGDIIINGKIYGGYGENAARNKVTISGDSTKLDLTGAVVFGGHSPSTSQPQSNTVNINSGVTLYGIVGGQKNDGTYYYDTSSSASENNNKLNLGASGIRVTGTTNSSVNDTTSGVKAFGTIAITSDVEFAKNETVLDVTGTICANGSTSADGSKMPILDITGATGLTGLTSTSNKLGTMTLVSASNSLADMKLKYSSAAAATIPSTGVKVNSDTSTHYSTANNIKFDYTYDHTVKLANSNKSIQYNIANNVAKVTPDGAIAWSNEGTARGLTDTTYTFSSGTAIDMSNLTFTGSITGNPLGATSADNQSMTLLSGIKDSSGSAYTIASGKITQPTGTGKGTVATAYTTEDIVLNGTASGAVTAESGALKYTLNSVTLDSVNLAGWDGTTNDAGEVPDGWTKDGAISVSGSFTEPTLAEGESTEILTAGSNLFSDASIDNTIAYKSMGETFAGDTANGVTLSGNKAKGVLASPDGTKLLYNYGTKDATNIALGSMTWGTGRTITGTGYTFGNVTGVDATNLAFAFTNDQAGALSSTSNMSLLSGATGLTAGKTVTYKNSGTNHTQAVSYSTANGAALSGTLTGTVSTAVNAVNYQASSMTLGSIDLTSWNGTASSGLPTGWTKNGAISVGGTFTKPTMAAGASKDILTATSDYFSDANIDAAIKYQSSGAIVDVPTNGVTFTGNKAGGVKATNSGQALTYFAEKNDVTGITLGTVAWGTARTADSTYDFSGVTSIDTSGLSFTGTATSATASTTLLTGATGLDGATYTINPTSNTAVVDAAFTDANNIAYTGRGNGAVSVSGTDVKFTLTGGTISGINLNGWTGTEGMTLPTNWKGTSIDVATGNFGAQTTNKTLFTLDGVNSRFSGTVTGNRAYTSTGAAFTNEENGVTVAGSRTGGIKVEDDKVTLKYYAETLAANSIILGNMTWGTGRTIGAGYTFAGVSANGVDATGLSFDFTGTDANTIKANDTMELVTNATNLGTDLTVNGASHSQAVSYTATNGAALSGTLAGTVSTETGKVNYKVDSKTLTGINLSGWDKTKAAVGVDTSWSNGLTAGSITAAGFTAPDLAANTSQDILTTTTNNFFNDTMITGAQKFAPGAVTTDEAQGVTFTGTQSKGVKASADGQKLVYAVDNLAVTGISLGNMTVGAGGVVTPRAVTSGFDFSASTAIDATNLKFDKPEDVADSPLVTGATNVSSTNPITGAAHSQAITNAAIGNGITGSGTLTGTVSADAGTISYTVGAKTLSTIDLSSWDGTANTAVDAKWTKDASGISVTGSGFTKPTTYGDHTILTATDANFFTGAKIDSSIAYTLSGSYSETEQNITLSGKQAGGVLANGSSLVYKVGTAYIDTIKLGKVTYAKDTTLLDRSSTDLYNYSNVNSLDKSSFVMSMTDEQKKAAKANDSMTLVKANTTINDIAAQEASKGSYTYANTSATSDLTVKGTVTGNVAAVSSNVIYTVASNTAAALTINSVTWNSGTYARPDSEIAYSTALVNADNITFTGVDTLSKNDTMVLVSNYGDEVNKVRGGIFTLSNGKTGKGHAYYDSTTGNLVYVVDRGVDEEVETKTAIGTKTIIINEQPHQGDVPGGEAEGDGEAKDNETIIKKSHIKKNPDGTGGDTNGGTSEDGDADENKLDIEESEIDGNATGGQSDTGNTDDNETIIKKKSIIHGGVAGGETLGGHGGSRRNKTTVEESTVEGDVDGGKTGGDGETEENEVVITGSKIGGDVNGGHSGGDGDSSGNEVTVDNSTVDGDVNGGKSDGNGNTKNNKVDIKKGSKIGGSVHGGHSGGSGDSTGNEVTVDGSEVDGNVMGGRTKDGNANNNTVNIDGGSTINGSVYGGYSDTGDASGNNVNIGTGKINGDIYGGYSGGTGSTINNTVTLYGDADVSNSNIIGGSNGSDSTGNTLNIGKGTESWTGGGQTVKNISSFDTLNFTALPWNSDTPALTIGDGSATDLSNTTVTAQQVAFTGVKTISVGSTMMFLDQSNVAAGKKATNINSGSDFTVGTAMEGTGKLVLDANGNVIYQVETAGVSRQTHNTVMAAEAAVVALNAGNDFILSAREGLARKENIGKDGIAVFAKIGGGATRQETGSHVNVNMWNGIVAVGRKNVQKESTTEYGVFVEHGWGNFSTHSDNAHRGDGSVDYTGGGLLGKWTKADGLYVEGSLRIGSMHEKANNLLRDTVRGYGYDERTTYKGFHLGVGKEFAIKDGNTVEVYGKYFYNRKDGMNFNAGLDEYNLDAVTSQILRVGARYTMKRERWNYYGDLSYEHELDGQAKGRANGMAIRGADTSGGSVRLELGAKLLANEKSPWTLDLNLTGYAGKKQGLQGGVSVKFMF